MPSKGGGMEIYMGFFKHNNKNRKKTENPKTEQLPKDHPAQNKTMFLTPEEQHISKDTDDPLIIAKESKIIIRQRREESEEPAPQDAPQPDYLLRIDDAHTKALLTVYHRTSGPFSEEELHDILNEHGIVHGIREKTLHEITLGLHDYEEVLIAAGTASKDGHDGFFEYHFNPRPATKPIVLPDGSVDYNVLGKIELVVRDQLLVTYHPAVSSKPGMDILGNRIDAHNGVDLPPLQCKNCELDANQYEYYATAEGNVTVEDNLLAVTPLYVIEGDLDAATGDVDFRGDVLVQGNVFAGVTVKTTGNITVNGHVEHANLYAGKDVLLKNGMQGSGLGKIHAKRNVLAKFLEQTQVYAGNEINTGALLNCEVESGHTIVVTGKRGTIIGGTACAAEQITAASLGNRVGVNTRLIVGLEKNFKFMMEDLDRKTEEYTIKYTEAKHTLERLTYQLQTQPATPELTRQKTEQIREKIRCQSKLNELSSRREHLIDVNQRSVDGKIITNGPAYVGVVVIINGISETLHSEYRDVTFRKNNREIRIISNKLI